MTSGGESDLARIADALYGAAVEEFTALRDQAAREAREAGNRELAQSVKKLRRPTLAAWAVNHLVRRRPDLLDEMIALGEELRAAQAQLAGEALRRLSRQRRSLVRSAATQAVQEASQAGVAVSEAARRQVEETLSAAMVDSDAARAVLSGWLTVPLASSGLASLGEALDLLADGPRASRSRLAGVPDRVPEHAPGRGGDRHVDDDKTDDRLRGERLVLMRDRLEEAERALGASERAVAEAERTRTDAQAALLRRESELEELRRRLDEVETKASAAADRLATAEDRLSMARATREELGSTAARLRAEVRSLTADRD